jgi:uncharacterized peroxidase-related enzyme
VGTLPATGLPFIEDEEADERVKALYAAVRRDQQTPYTPNSIKALAASPAVSEAWWAMFSTFTARMTLPESMLAMILYAVASSNDCRYCASLNELTCRIYGIDDETLSALAHDLGNVSPQRVRAIITFALKVAHNPQSVTRADYDELRSHGLSDEEMIEIVAMAAIGQLNDIMADALKIEVEPMVAEALGASGHGA